MRAILTALIALILSALVAGIVAVGLDEWARADEVYILVFLGIAPAALLIALVLLVSSLRGKRALNLTAMVLLALLGGLHAVAAAMSYAGAPSQSVAMKDVQLITALAAVSTSMILVQWLVFLRRA